MSDTANLTKKEQQELRGAEARISRVAKLQQQLEEARQAAAQNTVKKIEDINSQSEKLDERIEKADEQVTAAQQRKQNLVDRRDQLIKAKHVLADEIAEFLTPEDHERLGLDQTENVTDNTPLTPAEVEAVADSAHEAEEEGNVVGDEETDDDGTKMELEAEMAQAKSESEDEAKAETKAPAKARTPRGRKAQ